MARILIILLVLFNFCIITSINAASVNNHMGNWVDAPHSQSRLLIKEITLLDNIAKLKLEAQINIDNNWYIYWHKKGDMGLPTTINVIQPSNAQITEISWPNPILKNHQSGLSRSIYQKSVIIPINIDFPEKNIEDLQLTVNYLICGSSCIPVELDFTIDTKLNDLIKTQSAQKQSKKVPNLLFIILISFIGGLILNIMPCVLPVLSLKLLALLNNQKPTKSFHRRVNFLASASGIIVAFIGLSVFTIIMAGLGRTVGWGIHFTDPLFIIFLIIILMIFACNLLGSFTFNLPNRLLNFFPSRNLNINNQNAIQQLIGNFTSGIFATILATPCSAPFVGTALSFALSQGIIENLIIFLSLGVGMALPYLLLAIFPALIIYLPKPGAWMLKVKYLMGIALLLTVLWLLYVVFNQLGPKAAFLLFLLCLLLKFVLETHTGILKYTLGRWISIFIIIFCMFYIPLKTASYRDIHKSHIDSTWQEFSLDQIPRLIADKRVVVVDITADWCIICKMNKYRVLNREQTLEMFKNNNIVAMRVELTQQNRQEIMKYMENYQRFGLPFNIVYGPNAPEGILLKELLTFDALKEAIKNAQNENN